MLQFGDLVNTLIEIEKWPFTYLETIDGYEWRLERSATGCEGKCITKYKGQYRNPWGLFKDKSVTCIIEIVTYSPDEEQAYKYICEYKSTFRRGEFKSTEVECLCKELLRLMNVHLPKYSHFDCKISPNIYSSATKEYSGRKYKKLGKFSLWEECK